MNSTKEQQFAPPRIATYIAKLFLPDRIADNVIGDMEEEFVKIAQQDQRLAKSWYWQQTMETSMIYFSKKVTAPMFFNKLNVFISVIAFIILTGLIALLSSMDDPSIISENFWEELLRGNIFVALISESFWSNWGTWFSGFHIKWIIDVPSTVYSVLCLSVLFYMKKKTHVSLSFFVIFGYILTFLPMILGFLYLSNNVLQPTQVGPIIAFMLLSMMYMLLPVAYLINQKIKSDK